MGHGGLDASTEVPHPGRRFLYRNLLLPLRCDVDLCRARSSNLSLLRKYGKDRDSAGRSGILDASIVFMSFSSLAPAIPGGTQGPHPHYTSGLKHGP